ncbi:hypothetical protein, partial [Proteus mirabilis]|uniref:hypothetical protein n=1 Tax=Proteus mirabilis TaxID=584 RepID=UPI00313BF6A7
KHGCARHLGAQLFNIVLLHILTPGALPPPGPFFGWFFWFHRLGTGPTGREACRRQGRDDKRSNTLDSSRGAASLACGKAPA